MRQKHNYIFAVTRKVVAAVAAVAVAAVVTAPLPQDSRPHRPATYEKGFIHKVVLSREEPRQNYVWPD